jgi:hypothetical protein
MLPRLPLRRVAKDGARLVQEPALIFVGTRAAAADFPSQPNQPSQLEEMP